MLGVLVIVFVVADGFLGSTQTTVQAEANLNSGSQPLSAIVAFEASSTQFNNLVAVIHGIEALPSPAATILATVNTAAGANQITISHLAFSNGTATLDAIAPSENDIISFKQALGQDSKVNSINCPNT